MKVIAEKDDIAVARENFSDDNEEEKQEIESLDEEALESITAAGPGDMRVPIDPPAQTCIQPSSITELEKEQEDKQKETEIGDSPDTPKDNKNQRCDVSPKDKVTAFGLVLVIVVLALVIVSLGIVLRNEKQGESRDESGVTPAVDDDVAPSIDGDDSTLPDNDDTTPPVDDVFPLNTIQNIQVTSPKNLSKPFGYNWIQSLFGPSNLNGTAILQADVYYSDSNLCDSNNNIMEQAYPLAFNNANKPRSKPFILMGDRGGCTFVKKVRNAQLAGASVAIIADNQCLCSAAAGACVDNDPLICETRSPILADDGSGSDIVIPSFLLEKQDADLIKSVLKAVNEYVTMEISWMLSPNSTSQDVVTLDLFATPSDIRAREFIFGFKDFAIELHNKANNRVKFTPHMYIFDGINAGCRGQNGENMCYSLCTNGGRYCATDPDDDLEKRVSGADVVYESLRQLCIWEVYGAKNNMDTKWWDYVVNFNEDCAVSPEFFTNEACIETAMKNSDIDISKINDCMVDSGGLEGQQQNELLERAIDEQEYYSIIVIPTILFQGEISLGFAPLDILRAICISLKSPTPDICGCQTK